MALKRVLACVDFSDQSAAVIDCAATIATSAGAEVIVLHVAPPEPDFVGYEPGPDSVRDAVAAHLREEHRQVAALCKQAHPSVDVRPLMVQGATIETIIEQAGRLGVDLVVIGSHGHGRLHHLLAGNVTRGVLSKAAVPVVVVPPPGRR